jgi:sterol desaturase/sphingolipid hydroxylase (fatty acid hydroxylase superfamily)
LLVVAFLAYAAILAAGWLAMLRLLPTQLSITLAGHTVTAHSLHDHVNSAGLIFVLLPAALWLECMIVGWGNSSLRDLMFARTASTRTDLAVFLLGQGHVMDVMGRLMMLGASMLSGAWIHDRLSAMLGVAIGPPPLPAPLQVVLFFFVYTFFDYWTHRLDHTRYFWPIHRYHHAAQDFAVVTSSRTHPAAFTAVFVVNLPMAVLGAPADVMIYVNVLVVAIGFLIHSRIDSDWGWVGRWIVQSPISHRLHHKLDMSYPTGHFGMSPIWDRLFGTWGGEPSATLAIGVDTPYRHGWFVLRDLGRDYAHFWLGWLGRRNDGPRAYGISLKKR